MSELYFGSYKTDDGELRLVLQVGEHKTLLAEPFAPELLPLLMRHKSTRDTADNE